jgi:phage baseplate assembly protein gpV
MHSPHPIHRALVTYSNSVTGEIRVKIPALLGSGSEVSISYIGRKAPWSVPTAGDQIVVMADDNNLTNIFWVQTDSVQGLTGPTGPTGPPGDWSTAQTVAAFTTGNLTSASVGKLLYNTAACTLSVTSSTNFAVGQRVDLARLNAGAFIVQTSGTGVSLIGTPGYILRAQYSSASIICTSANTYLIVGDLS